jgi:uncharacterized protein YsxB (DUF464 family)
MIHISVIKSADGLLSSCKAEGHAGFDKKGHDIVSAAVSGLMRTALRTLSEADGIIVLDYTEKEGFGFEVACDESEDMALSRAFLDGVGAFLLKGLRSVADEYPEHCRFEVLTDNLF